MSRGQSGVPRSVPLLSIEPDELASISDSTHLGTKQGAKVRTSIADLGTSRRSPNSWRSRRCIDESWRPAPCSGSLPKPDLHADGSTEVRRVKDGNRW